MTTFFCPSCWAGINEEQDPCPHCGCGISAYLEGKTYNDRLIDALNHPEPTTPVRAAYILGMRRDEAAVPFMARKASGTSDVYLALACVEALGKIGSAAAREALCRLSHDSRDIVAQKAREMLRGAIAKEGQNVDP